jgi:hypothetical protein
MHADREALSSGTGRRHEPVHKRTPNWTMIGLFLGMSQPNKTQEVISPIDYASSDYDTASPVRGLSDSGP